MWSIGADPTGNILVYMPLFCAWRFNAISESFFFIATRYNSLFIIIHYYSITERDTNARIEQDDPVENVVVNKQLSN